MKIIRIEVWEFKDFKRAILNIVDRLRFIISKPKYLIGTTFKWDNSNYEIKSFVRNWEYNLWTYKTNSDISFSEGLITFHLEGK